MHACGHDAHIAMLLGLASIFMQMRDQLPGTIVFIFQPGEEGPPPGEQDGALQLIDAGVLSGNPRPEVIFGAHLLTQLETGQIGYRAGAQQAGSDEIGITVHGRQANVDTPWEGIDAIVVGSQIVLGLQTIASRQVDFTKSPIVLSIMGIQGGHYQAIADSLKMTVALDWYDRDVRQDVIDRVRRTTENIALGSGATAEAKVVPEQYVPSIYNDPKLVARMQSTLRRVAGADRISSRLRCCRSRMISLSIRRRYPDCSSCSGHAPPAINSFPTIRRSFTSMIEACWWVSERWRISLWTTCSARRLQSDAPRYLQGLESMASRCELT